VRFDSRPEFTAKLPIIRLFRRIAFTSFQGLNVRDFVVGKTMHGLKSPFCRKLSRLAARLTVSTVMVMAATDGYPQSTAVLQSPAVKGDKVEFDVASVRESKPNASTTMNFPLGAGDTYSPNGGLLLTTNVPLIVYVIFAYKIADAYEMHALQQQLPQWAISTGLDIRARTENPNPTKDQMRRMMRTLLADRFKLTTHYETQQVPLFALVPQKPGKTGPKLRRHPKDDTSCSTTAPGRVSGPAATIAGGVFPVICGDILGMRPSVPGRLNVGARNVTMGQIASSLNGMGILGRPVVDQTGFSGTFDFALEFTPEIPNGVSPVETQSDSSGPTFLSALPDQLGLKLQSQKGPVHLIIVDHVEHPSEN
jgi:uncharacterized protein (TIGR03435 family)